MVAKAASSKRASKRTLNAENLKTLGAPRLAELLMDLTENDPAAKRRLRLELAAADSPAAVARLARTRLGSLAKAKTNIGWKQMPALYREMEAHHDIIVRTAKEVPALGLELLWLFIAAATSVRDRCGFDPGVGGLRDAAIRQLGETASAAKPDPKALAEDAFRALVAGRSHHLPIIPALTPVLGSDGFAHLKRRLRERDGESRSGREPLLAIADAQGDIDEFLRLHPADERKNPRYAADIARRLLGAGRAEEALRTLDAATGGADATDVIGRPHFGWADARIAALEALDRHADAQHERWTCFERALSVPHLRTWVRQFSSAFDAMDAEERAFDHAERSHPATDLLEFFLKWPDLGRASALVARRAKELEGWRQSLLMEAAEVLAARFPLAAVLVLRCALESRLDDTTRRRTEQQQAAREAAGMLTDCAGLAAGIADFGAHPTHGVYVSWLREQHPYAYDFWSEVKKTRPSA